MNPPYFHADKHICGHLVKQKHYTCSSKVEMSPFAQSRSVPSEQAGLRVRDSLVIDR